MKDNFKNIGFAIAGDINDIYVPTLALLHNHFVKRYLLKMTWAEFTIKVKTVDDKKYKKRPIKLLNVPIRMYFWK